MSAPDGLPRLERVLDRIARRLTTAGLHPLHLRDAIVAAFDGSVQGRDVANALQVSLHPDDYARLTSGLDAFCADLGELLAERAAGRGWSSLAPPSVLVTADAGVARGSCQVVPRFGFPSLPSGTVQPRNPTKRLVPIRGLRVVVAGADSIAVPHLPFTIGRAASNDLVLASMAVSRVHAELVDVNGSVVVRDAGSRNGILVDGLAVREAAIRDGAVLLLGDVELTLRFDAQ